MKNKNALNTGNRLIRLLTLMVFFGSVISVFMIIFITSRMKTDQLTSEMTSKAVNSSELVIEFFEPVTTILSTMYSWGSTGKLDLDNPEQLNLMLVPLLDNTSMSRITGLSVADADGRNLFLLREKERWVARYSIGDNAEYSEIINGEVTKTWSGKTDYDPRKRIWFNKVASDTSGGGDIRWSGPYMFYTLKKPGVTASVKSTPDSSKKEFQVISCDLLLTDVQTSLKTILSGDNGVVFLMTEAGVVSNLTPILKYNFDNSLDETFEIPETPVPGTIKKEFFTKMKETELGKHTVFSFEDGKKRWWGSISPSPAKTGIAHLCIAVPENLLLTGINKGKYQIFILSFSVLAVAALVLTWLAWRYRTSLEMISTRGGYVSAPEDELLDLVNKGESEFLEFKSTLRKNLKTDKNGKEIELASLKTVVAFMNSDGGTLLIGVGDDGSILGLEPDNFENDDKALLHFNGLFAQHIGLEFSASISFDLKEIHGKKIFVIDSRRSEDPVFLKNKGQEEFYVRVGPGSRKLLTSEVIEYLKTRHVEK